MTTMAIHASSRTGSGSSAKVADTNGLNLVGGCNETCTHVVSYLDKFLQSKRTAMTEHSSRFLWLIVPMLLACKHLPGSDGQQTTPSFVVIVEHVPLSPTTMEVACLVGPLHRQRIGANHFVRYVLIHQAVQVEPIVFDLQTNSNPNNQDYVQVFYDGLTMQFLVGRHRTQLTGNLGDGGTILASVNNPTGCLTFVLQQQSQWSCWTSAKVGAAT